MDKKKFLCIILAVVAVIVIAAVKLNDKPTAGGQADIGTISAEMETTDGEEAEGEPYATSQATEGAEVDETDNLPTEDKKPAGDTGKDEPVNTPEEDSPGIDFDDLLS